MTCRTGLGVLVLALTTSASAVAWAQQPDEGEQPPAEGAQPGAPAAPEGAEAEGTEGQPPAEQPAEEEEEEEQPAAAPPGPTPAAPPSPGPPAGETAPAATGEPAPAATAGAQPEGADEVAEETEKLPPRVPWRGTSLKWGHAVTTTALGVGQDYISDSHEMYVMSWQLMLNYFLADQEDWSLSVYTAPGFSTELTNSDITTTRNEPQFEDLPLGISYKRRLFATEDKDFVTSGTGSFVFIFPTAPTSHDAGTYLWTSPRLSLSQSFPLLGDDAPLLQSVALALSGRWDHRFSEATTPVNPDLNYPRQTREGGTFLSDQLAFSRLAQDTLREGIALVLPSTLGNTDMELVISGAFSFAHAFKPEFENNECVTTIMGGQCVDVESMEDARTSQNSIGFSVAAQFFPVSEAGIQIGYVNSSLQLGTDGQRRSIFYSPDAMFIADVFISIDAIYERIIGPPRQGSFVLAKNKKKQQQRSSGTTLTF